MLTDEPVIRLKGLTVVRDRVTVLTSVDWEVRTGERWVLLGPNGSGKTTLLEVASTYRFPTRGHAEVLGAAFGRVDVRDLRPRIGYAGAALERRMSHDLTVFQTVCTGVHGMLRSWREPYTDADLARATGLLERVGVGVLAERKVATLSEGERRRVHLARSLMGDPDLWLLDEPTAGLDVGAREQLVALLDQLTEVGRPPTTVFVTHHVEEIPPSFTHLALVRSGQVMTAGPLAEVLTADALSECFATPLDLERRHGRWWARARML